MKIASVDCFGYELRYAHGDYVMSGARSAATVPGTLVRLRTSDDIVGWGEITPLGTRYLPVHAEGVRADLRTLAPALIGQDASSLLEIGRRLDAVLLGAGYAKSAIDIACWDLLGKRAGLPISVLLGGVLNEDFPLYEAVPLGSPESMAEFVTRRGAAGIKRFQLKVGNDPHEDAERVRQVVHAVPEETVLIADANGGWNLLSAKTALRAMAGLPVLIEQPCRDTKDCATAMRDTDLPLVLDETVVTSKDAFEAKYRAGAVAVNLKISRVGGFTRAARMRDLLQDLGLLVSLEDTWGGDVITAAVSHLAATTQPESLFNVSFFNDWTDGHVAGHNPRSAAGRGSAPTGPGLGIDVDPRGLELLFSVTEGA
jgi:cis-L-3-hydroxyproline dehydratase